MQWVQFEPTGWPGPKFYLAKPAIRAVEDGNLYAGLYIERGYPPEVVAAEVTPGTVMDNSWHWHGLTALWASDAGRVTFHSHLSGLRAPCAVIDYTNNTGSEVLPQSPLSTIEDYATVLNTIASVPRSAFINLIIGVPISKTRCLAEQEAILPELRNPIVRAWELHEIVQRAVPASRR